MKLLWIRWAKNNILARCSEQENYAAKMSCSQSYALFLHGVSVADHLAWKIFHPLSHHGAIMGGKFYGKVETFEWKIYYAFGRLNQITHAD